MSICNYYEEKKKKRYPTQTALRAFRVISVSRSLTHSTISSLAQIESTTPERAAELSYLQAKRFGS